MKCVHSNSFYIINKVTVTLLQTNKGMDGRNTARRQPDETVVKQKKTKKKRKTMFALTHETE